MSNQVENPSANPAAFSAMADAVSPYVGRKLAKQTFGVGGGLIAQSGPTQVLVNAGSTYVPALAMDPTTAESVLAAGVDIPTDCDGVAVVASFAASGDQTSNPAVYRAILSAPSDGSLVSDGQTIGACVVTQLPGANAIRRQTIEACFPRPTGSGAAFLRVTREAADGFDLWSGDANLATIEAIPVYLPEKPVEVAPNDAYNSWPMIISSGARLHCYYSKGIEHDTPSTAGRSVVARYSDDDGETWSAERILVDGGGSVDYATCGKGVDSAGNILLWVRRTAVANTPTMHLYRSTDGGDTFTLIASPTFAVRVIQITDIISVPTVGLMAFWMAGALSGEAGRSWGTVVSANDGATWTQSKKEDSADDLSWPTEISGAYLGSGKIMAIGRSEVTWTASAQQSMFQLTSSNYGSTFSRNRTNISDIHKSTPSVINDASGFNVYYFRRTWGSVRRRQLADTTTVFSGGASARLWPAAAPIAQFSNFTDADAGNANACVHNGYHFIAYYLGDPSNCSILVSRITP